MGAVRVQCRPSRNILSFTHMQRSDTRDWWVLGCDPIQGHFLVKCRLTQRTGVVRNASAEELLIASAKNFTPYTWIEPERASEAPLKPHVIKLAQKTQNLSTFMGKTKSLASRHTE